MQPRAIRAARPGTTSFSILGRIGGDATLGGDLMRMAHSSSFSILGRIGGDATGGTVSRRRPRFLLSVSSVGSEAMQRAPGLIRARPRRSSFQYPRSDRRRCNRLLAKCSKKLLLLSVSSVGSEAMQPVCPICIAHRPSPFQYPRSDRRRCNETLILQAYHGIDAFSILGRIGGDATNLLKGE